MWCCRWNAHHFSVFSFPSIQKSIKQYQMKIQTKSTTEKPKLEVKQLCAARALNNLTFCLYRWSALFINVIYKIISASASVFFILSWNMAWAIFFGWYIQSTINIEQSSKIIPQSIRIFIISVQKVKEIDRMAHCVCVYFSFLLSECGFSVWTNYERTW